MALAMSIAQKIAGPSRSKSRLGNFSSILWKLPNSARQRRFLWFTLIHPSFKMGNKRLLDLGSDGIRSDDLCRFQKLLSSPAHSGHVFTEIIATVSLSAF
jgi:hypothetical protein